MRMFAGSGYISAKNTWCGSQRNVKAFLSGNSFDFTYEVNSNGKMDWVNFFHFFIPFAYSCSNI